ncbi:MAG: guanylate kinase [Candidatus Omnitrophota bacterium]
MRRQGLIFVISGPSGSGKTTLLKNILRDKNLKKKLSRSVSLTTRPKRSGEFNKKDYFFVSEKQFKQGLKEKKILEWTRYLGYYYATPKGPVDRQLKTGKNVILCLDLKGAERIRQLYPGNNVTIFVKPPTVGVLTHRIKNRCHKTQSEEIRERVKLARKELLGARRYDYSLTNQDLECVTRELKDIISDNLMFKKKEGVI